MFRRLDLYYADPAQPLTAAVEELDALDDDLSVADLSVRGGVKGLIFEPKYFCR